METTEIPHLNDTVPMRQAAILTGVPYGTLKIAVHRGEIPAWRIGRTLRVRVEDVRSLITPFVPGDGGAA